MTERRLLEGKVAIVTGASRSIGAASARAFADAGAAVVLAARTAPAIAEIAEEINRSGGRTLAVPTDVTDPRSVQRLVEETVTTFGRLDVAFNNAGSGHMPRPLAEISFEDFESSFKANIYGVFLGMKYEIPAMLATGGGAIVNMSSTAGLQGAPGMGPYAAAKHGVVALTKTAAIDYGKRNIRVNALAPGPIVNEQMSNLPDETLQGIARFVPLGRLGRTDEVARAALWLCSDESSFITGAVLSIDGGRLAGAPGG
ncbi:MAG: short-chain dehydrogenase [Actinobacteria bacterium 13_1_40CM_2_65_8]|nr:MAG: short-chain dehydrogenase [Actinobacteria bacterium 13_1_40CM_2_65_8]